MSILTKKEREEILHRYQAESIADAAVIRALLDTIDALEARIDTICAIATSRHNTRVIGGAHAALREILAVIEGADEEGDQ